MVTYFVMLLSYDWKLTLLSMIFPPIAYFLAEKMKVLVTGNVVRSRESSARFNTATLERISNALTYRVYGQEYNQNAHYESYLTDYEKKAVRANIWENAMQPVYQVISMLGTIIIIWFGYVEQQFHMIPGSVRDQVSLRDPLISEQQIEHALRITGLWETVSALPSGIHTACTKDLFSQGQFQLLSIARAIVLNPRLLLLDEITANLDSKTEHQILAALKAASTNRTVISVSHRLYNHLTNQNTKILTI